jgi:hypothetical protein
VVIVIPVVMPPRPIFLLLPGRQFAEVAIGIAVVVPSPSMVVDDLVVIPDVVIAIVGVIDSVMVGAGHARNGARQRCGQEY